MIILNNYEVFSHNICLLITYFITVIKQVNANIVQITKDKSGDILKRVFNPVAYVLENSFSTIKYFSTNESKIGIVDKLIFWK